MLDEEYFLFLRCLLEISLESWSRTRKLNPEGNDAIHFDASFQKATPLSRYHFASSRALSFFFPSLLLLLPPLSTIRDSYVALTNAFFSLKAEKRGKKEKERGEGYRASV